MICRLDGAGVGLMFYAEKSKMELIFLLKNNMMILEKIDIYTSLRKTLKTMGLIFQSFHILMLIYMKRFTGDVIPKKAMFS